MWDWFGCCLWFSFWLLLSCWLLSGLDWQRTLRPLAGVEEACLAGVGGEADAEVGADGG